MKKLQEYLDNRSIPYLFDHQCNVLWSMQDKTIDNKANYLKRGIQRLERAMNTEGCYTVWLKEFGVRPENINGLTNQMGRINI